MFLTWPWPHVGVEIFKRFAPTLADSNSAPTVVVIVVIGWTRAAAVQPSPSVVLRGAELPVFTHDSGVQATAALGSAIFESAAYDFSLRATFAAAKPANVLCLVQSRHERDYSPAPKLLSSDVLRYIGDDGLLCRLSTPPAVCAARGLFVSLIIQEYAMNRLAVRLRNHSRASA